MKGLKTVFIDVSILIQTGFLTGIQRVTFEVIERLATYKQELKLVLLAENKEEDGYWELDSDVLFQSYQNNQRPEELKIRKRRLSLDDMARTEAPVFFDLDAAWGCIFTRTRLYPQLKKRNIRIISHVYDVIVISHPQFSSLDTLLTFPPYIAAVIAYSDHIIVNTDYTKQEIQRIAAEHGFRENLRCTVIPLGADFSNSRLDESRVHEAARKIAETGPYVLTVSTIEPRKNHKLLLDALDQGVADMGIHMVFAGMSGWNVSDLLDRIHNHPLYQKALFHLEGMNDDTIRYLYQHAMMVLFPTFIEGFGLSTIEAIQQGTPVACSDIPVMREVGKEYCDYFRLDEPKDIIDILRYYQEHPEAYETKKAQLKHYKPFTWNDMVDKVIDVIGSTYADSLQRMPTIRQMITEVRHEEIFLQTLTRIEQLMPFIEDVIAVCSRSTAKIIREAYRGKISIRFFYTEDMLIHTREGSSANPAGFLSGLVQQKYVDDAFVFSDECCRPLRMVDQGYFYAQGKMKAFYFADLEEVCREACWNSESMKALHTVKHFLQEHQLPDMCYESHMPQVISRRCFLEMLERYPETGKIDTGICSVYFNVMINLHPEMFHVEPYTTLMWPKNILDMPRFVIPDRYDFENYDVQAYEKSGVFEGCSGNVRNGKDTDAEERIRRYSGMWDGAQKRCEEIFQDWQKEYRERHWVKPRLMFYWTERGGVFAGVDSIRAGEKGVIRLGVDILDSVYEHLSSSSDKLYIGWSFGKNEKIIQRVPVNDEEHSVVFTFPIPDRNKRITIHLGYELEKHGYCECTTIPLMIT